MAPNSMWIGSTSSTPEFVRTRTGGGDTGGDTGRTGDGDTDIVLSTADGDGEVDTEDTGVGVRDIDDLLLR